MEKFAEFFGKLIALLIFLWIMIGVPAYLIADVGPIELLSVLYERSHRYESNEYGQLIYEFSFLMLFLIIFLWGCLSVLFWIVIGAILCPIVGFLFSPIKKKSKKSKSFH